MLLISLMCRQNDVLSINKIFIDIPSYYVNYQVIYQICSEV